MQVDVVKSWFLAHLCMQVVWLGERSSLEAVFADDLTENA